MNLTIGKSFSKTLKISPEKPDQNVCISMLGGVAKMCAKFNGLVPSSNNGLVGCLAMQPKLFGEVPVNFEFPCFDLNEQEIRIIETPKKQPPKPSDDDEDDEEEKEEDSSTNEPSESETIGGLRVEDIISVVSKTADQGIKIITELFGISDDDDKKPAKQPVESKEAPESSDKNKTKS